ncbi:MAG: bifunctional phosphoribosylaminoimidazolecarboxamide formyltransferase/IMP cyclohydrolase [Deltaproteobacteria bacterium]|nr:bifunctional phosphoribosylaminoimidazolecarboxamide formyltransferase/IMP cyclohydrolase [Deltaproteobacteria bacterium]
MTQLEQSQRYALVSVYDKKGLDPLVEFFKKQGVRILSSGGTATYLTGKGYPVTSITDYTQSPEILDGRVKTLHPRVHGGILARRNNPRDMEELASIGAGLIDYVVVNLYPFREKLREIEQSRQVNHGSLIELIDIGGPTLVRAAAKNFEHVVVLSDPADYATVMSEVESSGTVSLATRRRLAEKVFFTIAQYDSAVSRHFSLEERWLNESGEPLQLAPVESFVLRRSESLRYGENPHQRAAIYDRPALGEAKMWTQLQGKELSYNNLLDLQAAILLLLELQVAFQDRHSAAIMKHLNPCGAACRATPLEAFRAARECDPVSAFGGIVALSGVLEEELAGVILEGFVEVVIAEQITDAAQKVFASKKNVRLIRADYPKLLEYISREPICVRDIFNQYIVQTFDFQTASVREAAFVTGGRPSTSELEDLEFAWRVSKHVKSNAIVLSKGLQAIGVGAGQMSRVDSARLSLERAKVNGFSPEGAVAASDAFLPFSDTLEVLNDGGVVALVQPGGSIKDEDVKKVADQRGMRMVFTGERHFRH